MHEYYHSMLSRAMNASTTGVDRLTSSEVEELARTLQDEKEPSIQALIITTLGYTPYYAYEEVVAPFLRSPDGDVPVAALNVLYRRWHLTPKYIDHLTSLIRGIPDDTTDEFVRPTALGIAADYLAENVNPAMLSDLLQAYTSPETPEDADFELHSALEMILGYPGLQRAELIEAIHRRIAEDEVAKT